MYKRNCEDSNKMNKILFPKICKRSFVFISILFFLFSCILLTSCNPNPLPPKDVPPKMIQLSVFRTIQYNYANTENMPVCLTLDANHECEKINIIIEFENPSNRTISQVQINDEVYKKEKFSKESNSKRVEIENYKIPQNEGEYNLKVTNIFYQMPTENIKVSSLSNNSMDILVDPTFNLTLDISQGRNVSILTLENKYRGRIKVLSQSDMEAYENIELGDTGPDIITYGKMGYTFGGWFSMPNGEGKKFTDSDYFESNKDITLYAYYSLTCVYEVVDNLSSPYAQVVGLTQVGLTNQQICILEEYEDKPVTKIKKDAFKGMQGSREVLLPETMLEIGESAFASTYSINIQLKNVEIIDSYAFSSCQALTIGSIPPSVKEIREGAFIGCTWRTRIYNESSNNLYFEGNDTLIIPSTLLYLGDKAFKNSRFKTIYFWEESLLSFFGKEVFANSQSLTKIQTSTAFYGDTGTLKTSNMGLKEIGEKWFLDCKNLVFNTLSSNSILCEGLEIIAEQAFASGGIGAQAGMTKVVSILFPDSLKEIGKQAFSNAKLEEVKFGKDSLLEVLGDRAFGTTKLRTVTFFSLKTFGPAPFMGTPIEYLMFDLDEDAPIVEYVPHKPISLEGGLSVGNGFSRYAKIYVPNSKVGAYNDPGQGWWKDTNNKFNDTQPILSIDSIYELPGSGGQRISYDNLDDGTLRVTNIFRMGNENMSEITINRQYEGKTVTRIGSFVLCDDSLVKISLPDSVKIIEESAFRDAGNLYIIEWRDKNNNLLNDINQIALERIEAYAFYGNKLSIFKSTNNLKFIGKNAFASCSYMHTVELVCGPVENSIYGLLEIQVNAFGNIGTKLAPGTYVNITINANILSCLGKDEILEGVFTGAKLSEIYILIPENPPSEYKLKVYYYSFGNKFDEPPTIYFSVENGYEKFLDGKTNKYFNLGYCPWDNLTPIYNSEHKAIQIIA